MLLVLTKFALKVDVSLRYFIFLDKVKFEFLKVSIFVSVPCHVLWKRHCFVRPSNRRGDAGGLWVATPGVDLRAESRAAEVRRERFRRQPQKLSSRFIQNWLNTGKCIFFLLIAILNRVSYVCVPPPLAKMVTPYLKSMVYAQYVALLTLGLPTYMSSPTSQAALKDAQEWY